MELRTLRYLVAVAQEGNVSNAAAALHITQPTLSRQLSVLEDEVGCPLFSRTYKGMELNDNGAKLLRYAESILNLVEKAEDDLSSDSGSIEGSVHIGAGETMNMNCIGEAMKRTFEKHPEIDFQLYSGTSVDLMSGMARGAYDFLIECELKGHVGMNVLELPIRDRWGVVTLRDSRLGLLDSVRAQDLIGESLLMSRQAMKAGMLKKWAGVTADELDVCVAYNLPLNAALLVRAGVGNLLTYEGLLETGKDTNLIFVPLEPGLTSRQGIIWRQGPLSKQAEIFLQNLKTVLEDDML
jgi:DNA-binding transcriptional LysR family regulator